MGQKVNPIGFRVGINREADSRWFADRDYAELLHQDLEIKKYIRQNLKNAKISAVVIERPAKRPCVFIYTSMPGVIIGKKGADIESLKKKLNQIAQAEVQLNIVEVKKPEVDAKLVAQNIAQQLEKRASFRRVMKKAIQTAMKYGAKGIKINCSGRLGGAEIARSEGYREGRVPLHTLRADIDYATAEANTTYGVLGIKVWIYKGEFGEVDSHYVKRNNK
jgi:small subunit ribosomal protein S3